MPIDDASSRALFAQLIMMFQGAAMLHMGKVKNPVTDAIERDLTQAQTMIDMLEMIQARTRGNLSAEEASFIDGVLQELRLNYVDESSRGTGEEKPS